MVGWMRAITLEPKEYIQTTAIDGISKTKNTILRNHVILRRAVSLDFR